MQRAAKRPWAASALPSLRVALAACGLAGSLVPAAQAAPLDLMMTARRAAAAHQPEYDLGYDLANRKADVFGMRPKRADGSYGPSGNYDGGHFRLGLNLTPVLWLEGGVWTRKLDYVSVNTQVTSWQWAGQYLLAHGGDRRPSLAVRVGTWGNSAPEMRKNTAVTVEGTNFTSATAKRPRDRQLQTDLVATWPVHRALDVSLFAGYGTSKVDLDQASATAQEGEGCVFDVQFTSTHVVAVCNQEGTHLRVAVPNAVYGIDVDQEARYEARFATAGLSATWTPGRWWVFAGVQGIKLDRGAVDDIVVRRGGEAFESNTLVMTQVGYLVKPRMQAYLRAQLMAHQFVGELPMNYNSLTATQHRRKYGILSFGLSGRF